MPKRVSVMSQTEQLLNWVRAFFSGAAAATLMMAFIDTFKMLGVTPFTFETYLGSLILNTSSGGNLWTVGVLANWILGGVLGILYALFFEDYFRSSSARLGVYVGFGHAFLAAVAVFPFFDAIREFMGITLLSEFGFFGSGLGVATPILLLFAHLIFGATMGTFYGPVRARRVRTRVFEPGENLAVGHPDAITAEEDAEDRIAV